MKKKNIKTIIGLVIGLIIGISTTVGATTIFRSEDITYESDKTDKTNVKDSLDELYSKVGTGGECPENMFCYGIQISIANQVNLGDYISMTPTATSYTPDSSVTGYTGTTEDPQGTLHPSELNLWRVIKKNNDGTVEIVSEYVSSTKVYFYGDDGYKNLIGGLNTIAAQYTNEEYVQSSRHIGYSNQTETCTGTLVTVNYSSPCPNDNDYQSDYNLLYSILKTRIGKIPDGSVSSYYLASRYAGYASAAGTTDYYARYVNTSGGHEYGDIIYSLGRGTVRKKSQHSIRPVLTLKSSVRVKSGDGKSTETAYQLS